jgi:hypothetical protein
MLSFYLAFLYADKQYFDKDRMLCMSAYLFEVEQKNSLAQKGLLRRFSLDCYGKQPTMEDMRAEKTKKYQELNGVKTPEAKKEFEKWFFKYIPSKSNRKEIVTDALSHKTITKTLVLEEPAADMTQKQTKKRKPRKKMTQKRKTKDEGPYAKRTFYFGKQRTL